MNGEYRAADRVSGRCSVCRMARASPFWEYRSNRYLPAVACTSSTAFDLRSTRANGSISGAFSAASVKRTGCGATFMVLPVPSI